MRSVEFRPRASVDLEGIVSYIALVLKAPQAARDAAEAIYTAIDLAAELPETGRPLASDDLQRTYRRVLAKRYWICYSYTDETLTVWRIYHTTQDYDRYGFEEF